MAIFEDKVDGLVARVVANSRWRQKECFNLIPSETTPSLLVKMCEIADPSGRYAEHRTMKGKEIYFYQGIDLIRDVEVEAQKELSAYFQCSDVELRPISGQMANEVVFKAMVKFVNRDRTPGSTTRRLRQVMTNDLVFGGHLSAQPMGALFNYVEEDIETKKEKVVHLPSLSDNPYKPDASRLIELIDRHKPELIVFGKSMFLYPEPIKETYEATKDWPLRPVIMYDMAHILGLYGAFQKPFAEGADLVTGSTHKTFFGPQRGLVAGNIPKDSRLRPLWTDIQGRAFPGSTSNHHLGTLLGLLMASYEMNEFKEAYQNQVRKNAKAFARALKSYGLNVEGDEADGFTETHQVIVRVKKFGSGPEIAQNLENNNIIVNYQALPDDPGFLDSSGIRLGVQEMTRFGMVEDDFDALAGFIADVIIHKKSVRSEVSKYRQKFLTMRYCLPEDKAVSLAAKIFSAVFPQDIAGRFSEDLIKLMSGR